MLFLKKGQNVKNNFYLKFSIDHFKLHFDSTDKNNLVEKIVKTLLKENKINECENICKIITNKLCKSICLAMISNYYYKIGDKQNFKRFINDAIAIANEIDDKVYKTIAFGKIAYEFFNCEDLEKALEIIQKFCTESHYKDNAIRKIIIELYRNNKTYEAIEIIEKVGSNREKCYILLDLFDISPNTKHEFLLRKAIDYLRKASYGSSDILNEITKRYFLIGKITMVNELMQCNFESHINIPLYDFSEIKFKGNNFKEVTSFLLMFLNGIFRNRNFNQKRLFNSYLKFYIQQNRMKYYQFIKITSVFTNDFDKIEFLCQNIEIQIKKNDFALSKKLIKLAEQFINNIFDNPTRDQAIILIEKQKIKLGNWQIILSNNLNKKNWNPDKKKIIQPYIIKILCDQGKIRFAKMKFKKINRNNLAEKNKSAFHLACYYIKNNDFEESIKYFNEITYNEDLKVLFYIEIYKYFLKNNQLNFALNYLVEAYLYVEKLTYLEWSRGKLLYLIISEINNHKNFLKIKLNINIEDSIELINNTKDSYARDYQWFDLSLIFLERKKIEDSLRFFKKISNKGYYQTKITEYIMKMIEIYGDEKSFSIISNDNNIKEFLYYYLEIKGLFFDKNLIYKFLKTNSCNFKLIEILLTLYFLKCLMFSEDIENENLQKFKRVLNLQWAIDLKKELDQIPN